MDFRATSTIIVILWCASLGYGRYEIPEIKFEAFAPRGLRVSIPADKGVELFGFHGKINKPILQIEPGEISQDVTVPTNGRFVYVDLNIRLKENDVIHYWIFVQHDQLGFRRDEQSWVVGKLLPQEDLIRGGPDTSKPDDCSGSVTKVPGQAKICPGDTVIDYKFSSDPVDSAIWTVEKYISADPDWAFNIYRPDVVSVENDGLHIKPKMEEALAKINLNLNPGCTQAAKQCKRDFISTWNPPVVSGQLRSKKSFCFGNITIRAKLPIGDYMYPELYLEDVNKPKSRILIAYARGNLDYVQLNGVDDGGTKLFGGPHTSVIEPGKSKYLSSHVYSQHVGTSWHTFNVIWTPDMIDLYMDGTQFGHHDASTLQATGFDQANMVRLILGVGIGGPYQFPDGYTSSNKQKPYGSYKQTAIRSFVENKSSWLDSWSEDSQLLVDFVTVTAL